MRRNLFSRRKRFLRCFVLVFALVLTFASLQIFSIRYLVLPTFSTHRLFDQKHDEKGRSRVRGIRSADLHLYATNEERTFKCRSEALVIPADQVNDDFCDCMEDGSDEPGTEACPNGRFFCSPSEKFLPSSRVNDGICDCCDGSDEWKLEENPTSNRFRKGPCVDTCQDVFISKRKAAALRQEGLKLKEEYLEEGKVYIGYKDGLYGAQGEFFMLKGECFSKKLEKLRYIICPYSECMQESGGKSFLIGKGGSWEDVPEHEAPVLVMNGGERSRCPQGKQRKTKLFFVCGVKDEILAISESEVCTYRVDFSTPAAC